MAVIGLGAIGKVHAKSLKGISEGTLIAVSDADEGHARTAETLGVKFYINYEEMIEKEKPDGVVLAIPNELHAPVGITCAEKKIHLLVEKPIASTLSDADRLIEAVRKNHVRLLVGHHRRFNPMIETLREMVRGEQLGKLVGVTVLWTSLKPSDYFEGPFSWRKNRGGGPILINMIHEIDTLRYVCGEVTRVHTEMSNHIRNFPVEDSVSVTLRLENDVLVSLFLSDCVPAVFNYEANSGDNPFFYHSPESCYYFFGTEATVTFPRLKKFFYPNPSRAGWQYPITEEGIKVTPEDPYARELRHFCKVVMGAESPRTSGEDGKKTLEVTLAVQKSGESGEPIVFP